MPPRFMRIIAGAGLVALALFTHLWTRGDVGLGLFGGTYCSGGVRCETWSWETMQVAATMTVAGVALLITGVASLVAAIVAIARAPLSSAAVGSVRVILALTAVAAVWFVVGFCTSFSHAPPIGAGAPLLGVGLLLIWTALSPARVDIPAARVVD